MAPRRGGGGGSSSFDDDDDDSGLSSCIPCQTTLYLYGSGWGDSRVIAALAFAVLAVIAIIVCLFMSAGGVKKRKAQYRKGLLKSAALTTLAGLILDIIDIALTESGTRVSYLYYILYIIELMFYRIGEILIIAYALRECLQFSSDAQDISQGVNRIFHAATKWAGIALLAILACLFLAGFGVFIRLNVFQILLPTGLFDDVAFDYYHDIYDDLNFTYRFLYLMSSVMLLMASLKLLFAKGSTSKSKYYIILATTSLFVMALVSIIIVGVYAFNDKILTRRPGSIYYGTTIVAYIALIPLFIAFGLIAMQVRKQEASTVQSQMGYPPTQTGYAQGQQPQYMAPQQAPDGWNKHQQYQTPAGQPQYQVSPQQQPGYGYQHPSAGWNQQQQQQQPYQTQPPQHAASGYYQPQVDQQPGTTGVPPPARSPSPQFNGTIHR
ncbi:MAG: hypothetical protein M1831_005200 [Alyxoria varia]|nr:MAG: hypothetical protein M1831_005200 [Alyxoria varia]